MRFVQRPDVAPVALSAPEFRRMRAEYLDFLSLSPRRRAQTRPPDRHLPPSTALDQALGLAFDHKCAFCEAKVGLAPYRFRPTAEALPIEGPEGLLAYGWLADAWQNLYPICDDCRPAMANHFPVTGPRMPLPTPGEYGIYISKGTGFWPYDPWIASGPVPFGETPVLLDPTADRDIDAHLRAGEDGAWIWRSPRGEETVRHFSLNRDDLVRRRRQAAEQRAAALAAAEQALLADPATPTETLFGAGDEFAGFLRSLARTRVLDRTTATDAAWQLQQTGTASAESGDYSTPPALVRVEIAGYKGIEDLRLDLPAPDKPDDTGAVRLILGENAAGKSSLLEAIALALASGPARRGLRVKAGPLLLDPVLMGGRQARLGRGSVTLGFRDTGGRESVRRLSFTSRGFRVTGEVPLDLPVFAYGAYRHFLKAAYPWSPGRGIVTLFRSDNLLSNPNDWLLSLNDARFDEVVQALRYIFGPSGGFERIERQAGRCMVVTSPDPGDTAEIMTPLDAVSSGFRTMLALACDVMRWLSEPGYGWHFPTLRASRGILLIDEVEAHLHPRWKVQVMRGLREALPGMTIIATTHDPLCLRGMMDGEVLVLRRIPGAQADTDLPVKVEKLIALPDLGKLTIEQLLKSDFFALYDTDDPRAGASLAELADALAGLDPGDPAERARKARLVATFRDEVTQSLPVGRSEVSILVQEAVAHYIRDQRNLTEDRRTALREATKQRIVAILKGARDAPG